jgi:Lrp/AsnC family transcriptional regulator, regulator for asnA, asnC and gidA
LQGRREWATLARVSTPRPPYLDEVSRAIIAQLQEDGRRAYATIGKAVGLSEAAVRQRVQKLLDAGVMQIVAVTDPLQMGFAREALIGVATGGSITEVGEALAADPDIDYVVVTAGTFDLVCEAVAVDDDHLLEIITRIRAIPGVTRTETFLYLKLMKQTYDWGAN